MSNPESNSGNPEEILNHIYNELQSGETARILAALDKLGQNNFSSPAILVQLERLALHKEDGVRTRAIEILDNNTHHYIRFRTSTLAASSRKTFLNEIERLEQDGLLESDRAEIIKRRYNFDLTPPPAAPKPAPVTEPDPATSQPPAPAPRRTLTDALLSETSIKVALYLGAFFVVASALILAALIAAARLPILFAGTAIFGLGALVIHRRLPQPSFALFIVFSFLLPITANVIEEQLGLDEPFLSMYWTVISLAMAAVWAFATWLYVSRLFSITAFLALDAAFLRFGNIFMEKAQPELFILIAGLAALTGLMGAAILKRWKGNPFALPLFMIIQIQQPAVLFAALLSASFHYFENDMIGAWWLAGALAWILAAAFYVWSESLFSFFLFPWLSAAALLPVAWLVVRTFTEDVVPAIWVNWVWAAILSFASEAVHRSEKMRRFNLAALLASFPIFLFAGIWGLNEDIQIGFACLLGAALVYSIVHIARPRGWLWALALLYALSAYFILFELPFLENLEIFIGYKLLIASLLLFFPDLLLKPDFKDNLAWRSPLRLLGSLLTGWSFLYLVLSNLEPYINTSIVFGIFALFFTAYSLRFNKAKLFHIAALSAALMTLYAGFQTETNPWHIALTILAVIYYGVGYLLGSNNGKDWSDAARYSGLALGAIVSFTALGVMKENSGYFSLIVALLFALETFLHRNGYFEMGLPVFLSVGAIIIFNDLHIEETGYLLLSLTLTWLGSDLLHHLAFKNARPFKGFVIGFGALLAGINTILLLLPDMAASRVTWVCFAVSTVFFIASALLYNRSALGYIPASYFPLTILYLLRDLNQTKWLFPLMGIAAFYYVFGYLMRRGKRGSGWETTLLYSSLGLATLTSLSAPLQGGLDAAIPVAIGATLWAVEAFARRNVWLGFPANGLYLLAYFMILFELKVDEPQFYSMGAALLGVIMHYLLTRAGSKTGAFITGMVSQLVLLGTTYIQMLDTEKLSFFIVLFFQSLAVLTYGIIFRSRSLVFTPIFFVTLGVVTVVYSALKGISTVILIGCTGIILLLLGILAVLLRERLARLGEQFIDWQA